MKTHSVKTMLTTVSALLLLATQTTVAGPTACTYQDAVMAYEQNNFIRAKVLLEMAKRDGDKRAEVFLAKHFQLKDKQAMIAAK